MYESTVTVNGSSTSVEVFSGLKVSYRLDLAFLEAKKLDEFDTGFYVQALDANGNRTGEVRFVPGKAQGGALVATDQFPAQGKFVVDGFAYVDVAKAEGADKNLRDLHGVRATNHVTVTVSGATTIIGVRLIKHRFQNNRQPVYYSVDPFFKYPARSGDKKLRHFFEQALLEVIVGTPDGRGGLRPNTDWDTPVYIKEEGDMFADKALDISGVRVTKEGEQTLAPLHNGIQIPVENGIGHIYLLWVANTAQSEAKLETNLKTRFTPGLVWRDNPLRGNANSSLPINSMWKDNFSCGGGAKLGGQLVPKKNGIPDWLDFLLLATLEDLLSTKLDSAIWDYLNRAKPKTYLLKSLSNSPNALMSVLLPANPREPVQLQVDHKNQALRASKNFIPQFTRKTGGVKTFAKSKTPYGNALLHELRHSYIHAHLQTADQDIDLPHPDRLPKSLPENMKVSFELDGATTSIIDPDPNRSADRGDTQANNVSFLIVGSWDVSGIGAIARYKVSDAEKDKLPIVTDDPKKLPSFTFRDTISPDDPGYSIEIPFRKSVPVPGFKGAKISAGRLVRTNGVVEFTVFATARTIKDVVAKLKSLFTYGDYWYSTKDPVFDLHEMDAFTFTQEKEPEDD